jgi:hypothetical protein
VGESFNSLATRIENLEKKGQLKGEDIQFLKDELIKRREDIKSILDNQRVILSSISLNKDLLNAMNLILNKWEVLRKGLFTIKMIITFVITLVITCYGIYEGVHLLNEHFNHPPAPIIQK